MAINLTWSEKSLSKKEEELRQIIKSVEKGIKERIDAKVQQLYNHVDTVQGRIDSKFREVQNQIDHNVDRICENEKTKDQMIKLQLHFDS